MIFSLYYYSILMALTAVVTFFLAIYFWRSGTKGDATLGTVILISCSMWTFFYVLEIIFHDIGLKIIFAKLQYFPITAIPVLWFIFILSYSNQKRYFKKNILYLLCIVPVITVALVFTNERHNLIWQSMDLQADSMFAVLVSTYGLWFWIWMLYAYLLIILSIIHLLRIVFSSIALHRVTAIFFAIIAVAPLLVNATYLFKTSPALNLDITPFIMSLSSIILVTSLTRTNFKNILPIAKNNIIENMTDGVIITDIYFHIIYFNSVAKKIIGQKADASIGYSMTKIIPKFEEIIEESSKKKNRYSGSSIEIGPIEDKDKIFEAIITPIKDHKSTSMGNIILLRDITMLKKIHELEIIRESEERYKKLFENSLDGIYRSTIGGKIIEANPALVKMLGYEKKSELLSNMDEGLYFSPRDKFSIGKTDKIVEVQLKDRNSNTIWAEISQRAVVDEHGKTYLEGIVRNITNRKIAEEKVKWLTFHDKLTGLYNRAYFEEELLRLDTARQLPLGVMLGDLNDLKKINDKHGHQKGDIALKSIAEILKSTCRNEDVIARWGGDEFVILLPKTNESDIVKVIARIRNNIFREKKGKFNLSLALGFALKKIVEEDINEVIRAAEKMMYKDKKNIKSGIEQQLFLEI